MQVFITPQFASSVPIILLYPQPPPPAVYADDDPGVSDAPLLSQLQQLEVKMITPVSQTGTGAPLARWCS